MFFRPFSAWEYDEQEWPAVYAVEGITQSLICMEPTFFSSSPTETIRTLIRDVVSRVISDEAKPNLIISVDLLSQFISREIEAIREYASERIQTKEREQTAKYMVLSPANSEGPLPELSRFSGKWTTACFGK